MTRKSYYLLIILIALFWASCSSESWQNKDEFKSFLQETEHLNFNDPVFSGFMSTYLSEDTPLGDKLEKLYYFTRDTIVFSLEPSIYASEALKKQEGLCYLKAMIYASFCRRLGIPARLSQEEFIIKANPDSKHRHGIVKLFYKGKWIYLDTVSNPDAWYKWWNVPDIAAFQAPTFTLKKNVFVDSLYITNLTYSDFETNDVPKKWLDYLKSALAERGEKPQ